MVKLNAKDIEEAIQGKAYIGDRGTYNKGYHGLGDPNDKTLNEMEIKVAIPCWETDIIRREYCNTENEEYRRCRDSTYFYNRFYVCSDQKRKLNDCTEYWRGKLDLKSQATAEYLEERRLFRATGLNKRERETSDTKETRAAAIVNKIRYYVLNEEEMKQYQEKLKSRSKEN